MGRQRGSFQHSADHQGDFHRYRRVLRRRLCRQTGTDFSGDGCDAALPYVGTGTVAGIESSSSRSEFAQQRSAYSTVANSLVLRSVLRFAGVLTKDWNHRETAAAIVVVVLVLVLFCFITVDEVFFCCDSGRVVRL
jgi:hypothetical protein